MLFKVVSLLFVLFLRQELTMEPWQAWNLLNRSGWAQAHWHLPAFSILRAGIKDMYHHAQGGLHDLTSRAYIMYDADKTIMVSAIEGSWKHTQGLV